MDRVPHATGRIRRLTARLSSEGEAITTADQLASRFREQTFAPARHRRLGYHEFDALSQSGLLAITVPPEYGGIDISNVVLAKVTALLSQADARIGRIAESHYYTLEALRTDGTEEQKRFFFERALAGDRFAGVPAQRVAAPASYGGVRISRDGLGYRLNGCGRDATSAAFADWVAIAALNDDDKLTMSFIQYGIEGCGSVGNHAVVTAVLDNVYIHADAVVAHHKGFERPTTIGALGEILDAGIDLGTARKSFAAVIEAIKMHSRLSRDGGARGRSGNTISVTRVGELAVRLEAATALIESAGLKVDIAQIETTEENVTAATLAAGAAKVLTSGVALDASEALLELVETSSAGLDHDCRETGTRARQDPAHRKYHAALGNYHLNGVTLPSSSLSL